MRERVRARSPVPRARLVTPARVRRPSCRVVVGSEGPPFPRAPGSPPLLGGSWRPGPGYIFFCNNAFPARPSLGTRTPPTPWDSTCRAGTADMVTLLSSGLGVPSSPRVQLPRASPPVVGDDFFTESRDETSHGLNKASSPRAQRGPGTNTNASNEDAACDETPCDPGVSEACADCCPQPGRLLLWDPDPVSHLAPPLSGFPSSTCPSPLTLWSPGSP